MAGKPKIHPAAELFPMLAEWELKELAADIQLNGLQVPLVRTKDGQLLDGRNRWMACEAAGVPPRWETYEGDPFRYVVSANLHRRHLSDKQRAMVAARLANLGIGANQFEDLNVEMDKWLLSYIDTHGGAVKAVDVYADGAKRGYDKQALRRSRSRLKLGWSGSGNDWTWSRVGGTPADVPPTRDGPQPPTHAEAAELLNVSKTSVDRSRMVIAHGTEALQNAVEDGVIPLSSAARTAMHLPPVEQDQIVKRVRQGENWRNVVPSQEDAPDRRDLKLAGFAITRPRRPAPGGVRPAIDKAMMLRLVSGLDGYEVGLSAVERLADDITPEDAANALRVFERFGKTLRQLQRLLREIKDDEKE